jgi:hypothetical protein
MELKANYNQMDRGDFRRLLENLNGILADTQGEVSKARTAMLEGGYLVFDSGRLKNDLLKCVDLVEMIKPETFVESYPVNLPNEMPVSLK